MLARFLSSHPLSNGLDITVAPRPTPSAFRSAVGGRSFADGLYRVHTDESASLLASHISAAYPEAPWHGLPYGYDWLGRQFCAVDDHPEAPSLLFEPGTGYVMEIPTPFARMHDDELVDYGQDALAADFFADYLHGGGSSPRWDRCVGYRTPLFLGGVDDVANLELSDLDVYWHVMGQLILQTKGLPPGTGIDSITRQ